jgi:hypothetical protein
MLDAVKDVQNATSLVRKLSSSSAADEVRSDATRAQVRDFVEQYYTAYRVRLKALFADEALRFADERMETLLRLTQTRNLKRLYVAAIKDLDTHWGGTGYAVS